MFRLRFCIHGLIFAALTPSFAVARVGGPSRADSTAIVGVRIEIGDGKVIATGTVIIRDGKIAQIIEGDHAPAGVTVISGKGKTLYPGFIDGFTSEGVKTPTSVSDESRPSTSTTAPPTMWIGNRKGITPEFTGAKTPDISKDDDRLKSGITTALFAPTGGSLRGTAALVDLSSTKGDGRVINPAFGMSMAFRTGSGTGYPGNILGGIALMRQVLFDAKSLVDGAELYPAGGKKPSWLGSLEALAPVVKGKLPAIIDANMEREIERAIRLSDEFGFPIFIFGGRDAYKLIPSLRQKQIPVIFNVDIGSEPITTPDSGEAADVAPVEFKRERNLMWQERSHGAEALTAAGIPVAFSSEGAGDDFLKNVRILIKRGLSRDVALASLTANAAKLFGVADQIGTVAEGKRANLVLMSGEFENEKSIVEKVWVDGQVALDKTATVKK